MKLHPLFYVFTSIFLISLWLGWTRLIGAEYWPTPGDKTEKIMKLAGVNSNTKFYDLGSGFGSILIEAAREKGAEAVGIEIDPLRFLISKLRLRIKGIEKAEARYGSIYDEDVRDADIVFIFQRDEVNERLKSKLKEELKPGTKVVTYYWPFKSWEPEKVDWKDKIYVYQI